MCVFSIVSPAPIIEGNWTFPFAPLFEVAWINTDAKIFYPYGSTKKSFVYTPVTFINGSNIINWNHPYPAYFVIDPAYWFQAKSNGPGGFIFYCLFIPVKQRKSKLQIGNDTIGWLKRTYWILTFYNPPIIFNSEVEGS